MNYYLIQTDGNGSVYDKLEITETEYSAFHREIRKKRADEVIQSIKRLGEIIGTDATKSMIRAALREI